jgi:alpha-galactosidase
VLLLNRTSEVPASISVSWAAIGLDPASPATVRDLWAAKDLGSFSSAYTANVPAGDAVFVVIRGTDAAPTRYEAMSTANEFSGGAKPEPCAPCISAHSVAIDGGKSVTFKIAPLRTPAFVQIDYVNGTNMPLTGRMQVDGQLPTNILFASTGNSNRVGVITVAVEPTQTISPVLLKFSSPGAGGLSLESISVLAGQ